MTEETETPKPTDVAGRLDGLVGLHNDAEYRWRRWYTKLVLDYSVLFKFYGVDEVHELIGAMDGHIEKLQAKLPPTKDERPGYTPREG